MGKLRLTWEARKRYWMLIIFLGLFGTGFMIFYDFLIAVSFIILFALFVSIPLFKLEVFAAYSTQKTLKQIENDLTGKDSLLIELMTDQGWEMESYEDGNYVLSIYPSVIRQYFDKERKISIDLETSEKEYNAEITSRGKVKMIYQTVIREREDKIIIETKEKPKSRTGIIVALIILFQRKDLEQILSGKNYSIEDYNVSLRI